MSDGTIIYLETVETITATSPNDLDTNHYLYVSNPSGRIPVILAAYAFNPSNSKWYTASELNITCYILQPELHSTTISIRYYCKTTTAENLSMRIVLKH